LRLRDPSGAFCPNTDLVAGTKACAAIDGTLAIEFGQKSRLGGINEAGDVVSDIALFSPFALVPPFSITLLICLACMSEPAGIAGALFGSARRLERPLGKSDRAIASRWPLPRLVVFPSARGLSSRRWP
jgi:CDP-diacylglycerol--glycerol-3-phosphate 3-phosphatidyltransferase